MRSIKTTLILFFTLILSHFPGIGQDLEHYRKRLETAQNNKSKLAALDSLIQLSNNSDANFEEYLNYSQMYIDLASEMESMEKAGYQIILLQTKLDTLKRISPETLPFFDKILEHPEQINDSVLKAQLYFHRGNLQAKKNPTLAITDLRQALRYFSKTDTVSRAETHLLRGELFVKKEEFILAYDDFNAAYRLFESIGKHHRMIKAQQGITNMFSANGFNEKAIEERNRLIQIAKAFNLNSYLAEEYYNQAADYRNLRDYDQSYENLLTAEKMAGEYSSEIPTLIKIHSLFISHYSFNKQLDEAKKHLDLLESFQFNKEEDPLSEISYLNGRIQYLIAISEFPKALTLTQQKLRIAKRIRNREKIMESNLQLSEISYALQNYQTSMDYYRNAIAIKDSIYNKAKVNAFAYFQTLYETEKKERELLEQATSFSLLKKDNENFRRAMLLGAIAVFLGFAVILLYRNHLFTENRRKMQERFSQKLLLSQEQERKRISENLHDGVGQQLLVIKNRLIQSDDSETKKLLDDAIEEIRYISKDLHPFLLKELGITKAIEFTIHRIDENTKLFISTDIDNIDNLTTKENELNIYRIVQESLSNILKHAQAEAVKVSVKKIDNTILITFRDNGIGFDFNEKYEDAQSLGLKTLKERARFLNGTMKVTSKRNGGTIIEFQISI